MSVTYKQLQTHGWLLSTVATDAMVLKHQTIIGSIHNADHISIAWSFRLVSDKNIVFTLNNIRIWNWIFEKKKYVSV